MTDTKNHGDNGRTFSGRGRLDQLVNELERQKETRLDFVADCRALNALAIEDGTEDGTVPVLQLDAPAEVDGKVNGVREFITEPIPLNEMAFGQLCERSEPPVPVRYGRKLLAVNPAAMGNLAQETFCGTPNRRLFRCLDGHVRAVLSDSYRVMDHYDVAFQALQTCRDHGGEVIEASLDARRMRLKFASRAVHDVLNATPGNQWEHRFYGSHDYIKRTGGRTADELPGGPGTVHPTVVITNSETGHGSYGVSYGVLHAVCVNTSTIEDVVRGVHLGGKMDAGIWTPETVAAESQAVFLKARDAIAAAFRPETFRRLIDGLRPSAERAIQSPTAAANLVASQLDLNDATRDDVMAFFVRDYTPTALGLASAITRAAQDQLEPETAETWEAFAGELMTAPEKVLAGVE